MYVNQMQCRAAAGIAEGQAQEAVDTRQTCRINERERQAVAAGNLVSVADRCQMYVVVALLIGLKVNAVECPAAQFAVWMLMADEFEVHNCIFMIYKFKLQICESECKDKGFLS